MAPVPKPRRKRAPHFLRQWRKHRGKTQLVVAEAIGVTQSTISKVESGESPYDQDLLERLSEIYACEPSDLLIVNPADQRSRLQLITNSLMTAPGPVQDRALAIIEALLKAG